METDGASRSGEASQLVAVDAAGGDKGLGVQVEGAIQAFKEFNVRSVLVGPQNELRQLIDAFGAQSLPLSIVHASEVITMDDSPTRSVRKKPGSSLCVAYNLVESGKASSIISSGNSGAMMAAGRIICGLLPGVERPAIASFIPRPGNARPNVILDLGANVDCHAQNLVQFAIMGGIYYTSLMGVERPKVALLSNGSEPSKGTDVIRAASVVLAELETVNYVGFVEGRDIPTDAANVIVCDGFVGNVVLKSLEGCVRMIFDQLMIESRRGILRQVGMLLTKQMYREVFAEKFDYTSHGGAPLLGLRRLALVLHGSSDSRAVKNAIRVADTFAKNRMTDRIGQELTKLEESMADEHQDLFPGVLDQEHVLQRGKKTRTGAEGSAKGTSGARAEDE